MATTADCASGDTDAAYWEPLHRYHDFYARLFLRGAIATLVVAALSLVNIGISSAKPPLWAMPTLFLSGPGAAVGIATINAIGNLGGFVGPWMIGWIKDRTGSFAGGLMFVAGLLLFSAILTLAVARAGRRAVPARVALH